MAFEVMLDENKTMKPLITYIMICCFALTSAQSNFNYLEAWQKVKNYETDGRTQSALKVVETIFKNAQKDAQKNERIKALLYKSKYALILEENAQLNIVNTFRAEINSSDAVIKQLLQNMLATLFWDYFKQNRHKFYNRTKTFTKVDANDFRTWDSQTLFNEIHELYKASLENETLLQQESLNAYKTILVTHKNSNDYRPTLFDLLAHNALTFYKTDENTITKPRYQFKIDNPKYLSDSQKFTKLNITSKDSKSLQLQALKIYQQLLTFHQNTKNLKAFAVVDIERLSYIHEKATFKNKDNYLLKTLRTKALELQNSPQSALYNYKIALVYQWQGHKYNANETNTKNQWKLKEAVTLCDSVLLKYPKSNGAKQCEVLKSQLELPNIRLQNERFVPVNLPSKVLVTYKNLTHLQFSIYKVSQKQIGNYNKLYKTEDKLAFFKKLNLYKSFNSKLKSEGDYQSHSTEIVIPKLANGFYLMVANTNTKAKVFATTTLQVTNIALIEQTENDKAVYQIINRNNGKPIAGATININYDTRRNKNVSKQLISDGYGEFVFLKDKKYYNNIKITVNHNNEKAYFGDFYLGQRYKIKYNDTKYKTFLFTDRSIYRPSQTVYFKGIATQTKNKVTAVTADEMVTVTLHNVNGEILSTQQLKTNAYGSFSSEFVLPSSGLTGQFYIKTNSNTLGNQYHYFSVENYKRPKFKTEFKPITQTYKVMDSVTVNGNALAFAGSAITNAKVVYKVKRMVQYPRWYYWHHPYGFGSEAQEITFGETKTNAKGAFNITFKALPDETASKDFFPVFNYEITADVTDINGETQSATTIVNVGYHSIELTLSHPEKINTSDKEATLKISSQNLNGEATTTKGTLKIYKLIAPNRVLRKRPWLAPDYQVIPKESFTQLFPNEAYSNEDQLIHWKKETPVFSTTYNTNQANSIVIKGFKNWEIGKYIIVAESKDPFGQTVKDESYVTFVNTNNKTVADKQLIAFNLNKDHYNVGDIAKLTLSSAANIAITVSTEKQGHSINTQIITLNNSKTTIEIPIEKNDVGGFMVHYHFAFANTCEQQSIPIAVPYPKTELQIETATFRDKLQPNKKETWQFKIKGPKGEKVSAEVLASMYDASLDAFLPHQWQFYPTYQPQYSSRFNTNNHFSFGTKDFRVNNRFTSLKHYPIQRFNKLNWFGFGFGNNQLLKAFRGRVAGVNISNAPSINHSDSFIKVRGISSIKSEIIDAEAADLTSTSLSQPKNAYEISNSNQKANGIKDTPIQFRKNLKETAFFYPHLQTDNNGDVTFSFTTPEALTQWKLQLLAHTKTIKSSVAQFNAVTQKQLMVIPNVPRFLREGDTIAISTKIANVSNKNLTGNAQLILINGLTGETISNALITNNTTKPFTVKKQGNTQVTWQLAIPRTLQVVEYKIIARAENYSDGEQNVLPVLSNRMLVTETLPMWIGTNQTKTFTLNALKNNSSKTLKHHKLTLEATSNPAWYAVQALPYLMEYPYQCNEQTFSRYYANTLAHHIATSNPKIQQVFKQWASGDSKSLLSNLEKNQELKSLLISETPWLRDAQSETEQKKRIALLFDFNKMSNARNVSLQKLKQQQLPSGGWSWFNGGHENRYITQHIIAGFGHLKQLNIVLNDTENAMITNAITYLDNAFVEAYNDLKKYNKAIDLNKDHLTYTQLHYLYMRSFYLDIKPSKKVARLIDYYINQIKTYWLQRSLYAKGLMVLILNRMDASNYAGKILKSLQENSITSKELGMYWNENTNSWYWHQAPIETQALLIEAFSEAGLDIYTKKDLMAIVDNLKIWLLKNKQTNQWKTTKATTNAIYALLLSGSDWLNIDNTLKVTIGDETVEPSKIDNASIEAGTGYFKTAWNANDINANKANVTLTKSDKGIAWAALYWQYFEDLDKIVAAETPLQLTKKLFIKENSDSGKILKEITKNTSLTVGDIVTVRIQLQCDRPMEFVHLKDMRASGFEPVNVLSQYKWQDGLGYYESTKDASTNFFIEYLPKGVYVFEYDVKVNNAGTMSNGISTIQSMYAPEFNSHSEGINVVVE